MIERHSIASSISTVLFDFDDTLIDSRKERIRVLQSIFASAGITGCNPEQFLLDMGGTSLSDALSRLEVEYNLAGGSLFENYRRMYWSKKPGTVALFPGVREMLETLDRLGVRLGIVTSKGRLFEVEGRRAGAVQELEEIGVIGLFPVIVGFEDVNNYKPHPEGICLALSHLGAQPQETLFVGDTAADMEAATAAKCRSCYATWGIRAYGQIPQNIEADMVIEKPEKLSELFLQPSG